MSTIGTLAVNIVARTAPFQRDMKQVRTTAKQTGNAMAAMAQRANAIGIQMLTAGSALAAPFALSIKTASDMQEVMSKFDTVFASNAAAVKRWSDQFSESVGRSKRQIAEFMAGSQDLFVPLGFAEAAAVKLSKQVTGLAVDLASFNNMADADVLRDLHAALTGSGEVMKKYGVIVSEAAVKQQLFNTGIDPKFATDQQKVLARLQIIMAGTTAAQGDAARTSGSFANQMKALQAAVDDAAVAIGSALLPVVTPVVTAFASGVATAAKFAEENAGLVKVLAAVAATIVVVGGTLIAVGTTVGVVTFAVSGLAVAWAAAGTAAATAGAVMAVVLSPLTLIVAAITALGVVVLEVTGAWDALWESAFGASEETKKATSDNADLKAEQEKLAGVQEKLAADLKAAAGGMDQQAKAAENLRLKTNELWKAAADERRQQQIWDMMERGAQVMRDMRTPVEELADSLAELNALQRVGAIDATTFQRATAKARADYQATLDADRNEPQSAGSPRALEAGTTAAFSRINELIRERNGDDEQGKHTELLQNLVDLGGQQLAAMKEDDETVEEVRF